MAHIEVIDLTSDDDDEAPAVSTTAIETSNAANADFQPPVLPSRSALPRQNGLANIPTSYNGLLTPGSLPGTIQMNLPVGPPPPKIHAPPTARQAPRKSHLRELPLHPNGNKTPESPAKRRRLNANGKDQKPVNTTPNVPARKETRILPPDSGSKQGPIPSNDAGAHLKAPSSTSSPTKVRQQSPLPDVPPVFNPASVPGSKNALRKHIFTEIKSYLKRSGNGLDDATLMEIGKKVSDSIASEALQRGSSSLSKTAVKVCDSDFFEDLRSNNGALSEPFKMRLRERCTMLAGIFVNEALENALPSKRSKDKAIQRQPSPPVVVLIDSSSESGDGVFHDASEGSSPTTSFTVESPTKEQALQLDGNPEQSHHTLSPGEEQRDFAPDVPTPDAPTPDAPTPDAPTPDAPTLGARASQRPRSNIRRTQGLCKRVKNQPRPRPVQVSPRKASAIATALRQEVEALRLAGLDNSIRRPYLGLQARRDIENGLRLAEQGLSQSEKSQLYDGQVVHVDFSPEEVRYVRRITNRHINSRPPKERLLILGGKMKVTPSLIQELLKLQQESTEADKGLQSIKQRTEEDLRNFIQDSGKIFSLLKDKGDNLVSNPSILRIAPKVPEFESSEKIDRKSITSILRDREMSLRTFGRTARSTKSQVLTLMDDMIMREAEFTGCSGDIAAITWLPGDNFICGAITHSDESNQQYNKAGNLVLGSAQSKTLRSVSGHRISRPIVHKGSNSLASMRETQDRHLYCSVTSTAYHEETGKAFTSSFDRTVKIWDVAPDGSGMTLCGSWGHTGVVNFVATSPHHNKVVTAADVLHDAIRVYDINQGDVSNSSFISYSGSRAEEKCAQRHQSQESWAYYPSTLQWGKAPRVSHLLLVGYSPRTFDVHQDVPEDKEGTGELCIWDTSNKSRVLIGSARTQNVFEVVWHPTQPIFVAATSASGEHEGTVRTQLRLFTQSETGSFCYKMTFDCCALDINEITIMPNSAFTSYVTASCTDGNTYVWDSARGEDPIHILRHAQSIDTQIQDVSAEEVDSGVKFAAWGRTIERFYTGSSDGILKAWNIRAHPDEAHVSDIITLSGGISAGAFSADHSRLLIGDATGKVHLLRTGELNQDQDTPQVRAPQPIIPDTMELSQEPTGTEMAHVYVDAGQIVIHPDPYIGAVQGDNYSQANLFCRPLHQNEEDPLSAPLEEVRIKQTQRYQKKPIILPTQGDVQPCPKDLHHKNFARDLRPGMLDAQTTIQMEECGAEFRFEDENDFEYEPDVGRLGGMDGGIAAVGDMPSLGSRDGSFLSIGEIHEFQQFRRAVCFELEAYKAIQAEEDTMGEYKG